MARVSSDILESFKSSVGSINTKAERGGSTLVHSLIIWGEWNKSTPVAESVTTIALRL
jgi:hypothetical protein